MCPVCFAIALLALLLTAVPAVAQMSMPPAKTAQANPPRQSEGDAPRGNQKQDSRQMDDMGDMPGMSMSMPMPKDPAAKLLMEESSGTSVQPRGWTMPMVMTKVGSGPGAWQLAWMAQAFLTDVQQSHIATPPGEIKRGGDKLYSTNWGMLSAEHALGGGAMQLRAMLSLEPATITRRRYPELFQVGETAYGQAIEDGQHPHNFVMEASAQYAHRAGSAVVNFYYAPVGDPSLGPTAYPHRASAAELPQATLAHHYEDSTHIADNVATAEVAWTKLHVEASGFHGREPGENRWTVGFGAMDSWSARVTWLPAKEWAAQLSTGRIRHPEALEAGDEERTTASVEYAKGERAASMIWGRDYKTRVGVRSGYAVNAVTLEAVTPVGKKNYVTGRMEWSQRDELFAAQGTALPRWIDVTAFTGGYTRELGRWRDADVGIGANATGYKVDDLSAISSVYGTRPWGASVYVRVRLKAIPHPSAP